ncbi:very large A-kinase anchor protein [Spea bombifrons]|uniref:very large A-kinase anchor protein n=1 Tax=Spea bombifrons TaxID=233779 RepID=UPI00234A8558|nr:very large A-kinase anchor protein [Spea bombifrons]
MSIHRRPGTWQEEVAKGFSRFFSRTSSQEKEEESEKTTSSKDSGDEQEKTEKGISRLFLRASSTEKKEGNEKSSGDKEPAEDQAKGQSSSRLFFRKISQDNKGESDQVTKDEPDKGGVFSRLFTRASSQEKEEDQEKSKSKGANQDPSRPEEKNSPLTTDNNQNLSSPQQITSDPHSLTTTQNTTRPKVDVEFGLFQDVKGHDSEKQSKENFLHFIGNLFNLSSKSSQGNSSQAFGIQELTKENDDAQAKQNLDTETLNREPTLDVDTQAPEDATSEEKNHVSCITETSSVIAKQEDILINEDKNHVSTTETSSETPKQEAIPTNENTIHVSSITETSSEITKQEDVPINEDEDHVSSFTESTPAISKHENEQPSSDLYKQNPSIQDGPAITYGTYRGSRRIRKLLKRRPDVNSPIPEREETSERENSTTPDDRQTDLVLDPYIDLQQNAEGDMPPHTDTNKNSSLTDDMQPQTKENVEIIENPEFNVKITEDQEPNKEGHFKNTELLQSKKKQSSEITNLQEPHKGGTSEIIESILPCEKDTSMITKSQQLTTKDISRNAEKHEQLADEEAENVLNTRSTDYVKTCAEDNQGSSQVLELIEEKNTIVYQNSGVNEEKQPYKNEISTNTEHYQHPPRQYSRLVEEPGPSISENVTVASDNAHIKLTGHLQTHTEETLKTSEDCQPIKDDHLQYTEDHHLHEKTHRDHQPGTEEISKITKTDPSHAEDYSNIIEEQKPNLKEFSETKENQQPCTDTKLRDTEYSQFPPNPTIMEELKPDPTKSSFQSDQNKMPLADVQMNVVKKEKHLKEEGSLQAAEEGQLHTEMSLRANDNHQQELTKQPVTTQAVDGLILEATEGLKYVTNQQPYVDGNTGGNFNIIAGEPQSSEISNLEVISHNTQKNVNEIPQNIEHLQPNVGKSSIISEVVEPHVSDNSLNKDDLKGKTTCIHFISMEPQPDLEETSCTNNELNNNPLLPNNNVSTNTLVNSTKNTDEEQLEEKKSSTIKTHILPQTIVDYSQMKHNSSDDYVKEDGTKYISVESCSGRGNDDSASVGTFPQDSSKSVLDTNTDSSFSIVSKMSSENNSDVKRTALALSFDNSIDIPSPPLTTMSDSPLTPSACIGLRNDSPLTHSDEIDSGVVSSQAYTPEENMGEMSPSDLYDNTRYDLLERENGQENSVTGSIEAAKKGPEGMENAVSVFGGTSKLETLPSLEENDVLSINGRMPITKGLLTNVHSTTDKESSNDLTMAKGFSTNYRDDNPTCSINSKDVCVAKVLVKSVDIEEVKLAPTCFQSEVISVSKLETPRFEPEYVCLPNPSPPPAVTTHENDFQIPESESHGTFQKQSADSKTEGNNANNQSNTFHEFTPKNINQVLSTEKAEVDHEPSVACDLIHGKNGHSEDFSFQPEFQYEKLDRSPLNFEVKETHLANKIKDIPVELANTFPNEYTNINSGPVLDNELPVITSNSPDVENLKNNNVDTHVTSLKDNFINIASRQHKSFNENADGAPVLTDSQGEYENLDSLRHYPDVHHSLGVIHTAPEKSSGVLDCPSLQGDKDISNEANGNCPVSTQRSATPIQEWNLADHLQPSDETFIQKADEIIDTVLHTAIKEVQQTHDDNVHQNYKFNQNLVSLSAVEVKLAEGNENGVPNVPEVTIKPTTKPQYPENNDPFESVAAEIVNEVIVSAKQNLASKQDGLTLYNSLSNINMALTDLGKENNLDSPHSDSSSLEMGNVDCLPFCEINSNVLLPIDLPLNHSVTKQKNGQLNENELSSTRVLSDQGNIGPEHVNEDLDNKIFPQIVTMATTLATTNESDGINELEADSQIFNDNNQRGYPPLPLENTFNEETTDHNSDVGEQSKSSLKTHEELSAPLDFSVHNGHYIEITESDEEMVDEGSYLNHGEEDTNSGSFLAVQSRRVRIYPLSLSPIYEDDSSTEDILSNHGSPGQMERKKDDGCNANDHSSILSLLQSVSDRLKQESDLSPDSDCPSTNGQSNQSTIEATEIHPNPSNRQTGIFNENEEKTTAVSSQASLSSGLFITKSAVPNWPSSGLGRQSFLLQMSSQKGVYASKSAKEPLALQDSSNKTSSSEGTDSKVCDSDATPSSASHSVPVKAPSTLQVTSKPNLSTQKPDTELKPRLTSQSVYYQYFHDTQNYAASTENKENPIQQKLPSFSERDYKDSQAPLARPMDSGSVKSNPRPGKVVISDIIDHDNKIELKSDILDASSVIFPNGVNIRVIRGCWILYEKPNFQGQAHVLEEGEAVLQHLWDSPVNTSKPDKIIIGSVKRIANDHLPEVVLNPAAGEDDNSISMRTEIPSLHLLVHRIPLTLTVMSGVWLAYTETQYTGSVSVLEEGCVLSPVQDCDVQSLRPLKMGGLKVQLPSEPKIILYEKPHFEGWSRELTDHLYSIKTLINEGEDQEIGSIRVIGGIWVGYEKERYKGLQYLLEEGDYEDWKAWGGFDGSLQSIRYLHADFLETSITLLESEAGDRKVIDLFNQAVPDLELAGYTTETQSIHVKKGIWVAYQHKHFCGEQHILEKGRYKSCVDWGGRTNTIMSIRPVLLEPLGKDEPKHLIKAYSLEDFQGQCEIFTKESSDFQSFPPRSFKVLRGCWILCYQAESSDNLCVLEEGNFPDLVTCGCPAAVIKYIKPIDYVFAEPSISLFALDMCEGREMHFEEPVTSVLSKDLNFYTQSIWLKGGLWIVFEGANFLGRQMLLEVGQISNWTDYSGWRAIGSLRPLKQPAVYFRVKNRLKDKYLTVTGKLTDTRATFVCVSARNGQSTQIWYFCRGLLKSKANHSCLDVIGGKNLPGSKVSLWTENGQPRQKWRINKDGTITSYISDDLVLDVKGGNFYDQNYAVMNRVQEDEATQKWDIEIL